MVSETLYDFLARRERDLVAAAGDIISRLDGVLAELLHVRAALLAIQHPADETLAEMARVGSTVANLDALPQSVADLYRRVVDAAPELEEPEPADLDEEREPAAYEGDLPGDGALADAARIGVLPELILRLLPGWMEEYPGGPTILQVAAATRLDATDVRKAFWALREQERAVVYRESSSKALHVAPLDFVPPAPEELSDNQEKVLDYLGELRPDAGGCVTPPSSAAVHEATGVPIGSLGAAVSDLERKGKIEVVERGRGGLLKPRYRVLSNRQLLRQALVEPGGTRDATAALMGDPPPARSALAEKPASS